MRTSSPTRCKKSHPFPSLTGMFLYLHVLYFSLVHSFPPNKLNALCIHCIPFPHGRKSIFLVNCKCTVNTGWHLLSEWKHCEIWFLFLSAGFVTLLFHSPRASFFGFSQHEMQRTLSSFACTGSMASILLTTILAGCEVHVGRGQRLQTPGGFHFYAGTHISQK